MAQSLDAPATVPAPTTASSPRATRLATPRWLDLRLVLGVLLVLVAVVAGSRILSGSGRYTQVYVAAHPLTPGERLTAADVTVGRVRFAGQGFRYVAAAAAPPVGYLVTRYVGAGELVPLGALSASTSAPTATRLVTLPVAPGHLPDGLAHGDLVDVYLTAKTAAGGPATRSQRVLSGVTVDSADTGSHGLAATDTVSVVLDVPADRVPIAVHAAETGAVDLVRVPPAATAAATASPAPGSSAP